MKLQLIDKFLTISILKNISVRDFLLLNKTVRNDEVLYHILLLIH